MAVTAVKELMFKGHRSGSLSGGVKSYRRTFLVTCSVKTDDGAVATGAGAITAGLPEVGDVHPTDAECWLEDMSVDSADAETPLHWHVVCTYTNKLGDTGNIDQAAPASNPDNDPVVINWTSYEVEEVMEEDADGTKVLNTAGDPYDPPLMREVSIQVAHVEASATSIPTWFKTLNNTCNNTSVTFQGESYGAGYVLLKNPQQSTELTRNSTVYRRYSFELHLRNDRKWTEKKVLSQGFMQVVGGVRKSCVDDEGVKVTAPVPLDSAGAQISVPTTANAYYQTYVEFEDGDLTVLPGVT